jgi:hypothetical protein
LRVQRVVTMFKHMAAVNATAPKAGRIAQPTLSREEQPMSHTDAFALAETRDLETELNYLALGIERPRTYTFTPPDGEPQTTFMPETHRVVVRDVRGAAERPTLDREGFALIRHRSAVQDFWDDTEIRARFYPEVEAAIIAATGADSVFIFDHTLRRRVDGVRDYSADGPRQPVPRVHVDHTARSGPQRVRDLLPESAAEEFLRGRVQIINFWRPIVGPLRDWPLAVADASTVAASDLVPTDLVYPHRVGETYAVRYNPAHRWFYVSDMEPDEALLLKCFDSKTDGRARFAPHTAFRDPTAGADIRPRESIEVRTLVFHAA